MKYIYDPKSGYVKDVENDKWLTTPQEVFDALSSEPKAVAEITMTEKTVLLFEVSTSFRPAPAQVDHMKESLQAVFGKGRIALLYGATLRGAIHHA